MNKSILIASFTVLTTIACALSAEDLSCVERAPSPILCEPIDLYGHYEVENGIGITLSASALYWNAYEDGLDYAIKNEGSSGVDNDGSIERACFDWDWGVRVDLGYEVPAKKLNLDLSWTYYKTEKTISNSAVAPTTLFSVWTIPSATAGTAFEYQSQAHSHLRFDMLDFGINTTFSPRPLLDITPFIDLSTVWIHQKFQFDLSGGPGIVGLTVENDQINMKNNFWGIGPKMGLDTLWNLGCGFGICGNFNFSLLYGIFNITQDENTTYAGSALITNLDVDHNKFHAIRLNLDLFLGLRYDQMFCCDKYHFLFEAGWENLLFLGQNQLMRFTTQSNSGINVSSNGDLGMQGLSVRAAFTF